MLASYRLLDEGDEAIALGFECVGVAHHAAVSVGGPVLALRGPGGAAP